MGKITKVYITLGRVFIKKSGRDAVNAYLPPCFIQIDLLKFPLLDGLNLGRYCSSFPRFL